MARLEHRRPDEDGAATRRRLEAVLLRSADRAAQRRGMAPRATRPAALKAQLAAPAVFEEFGGRSRRRRDRFRNRHGWLGHPCPLSALRAGPRGAANERPISHRSRRLGMSLAGYG